MPLLMLMGEADTWTPFPPCEAFLEAAKARGNPIEIKSYPGVYHAFDSPDLECASCRNIAPATVRSR